MFTGIVEEVGKIRDYRPSGSGARMGISCRKVLSGLNLGDSVCVSGVCLTAVEIGSDYFTADISSETLKRSYLGQLGVGRAVNLERALAAQGRLGGHLVNGHVDDVGKVLGIPPEGREGEWSFSLPKSLERYVVKKGSIAVDGISLTVANLSSDRFSVAIIPTTVRETNLAQKKVGDPVNLEVDILAKYVEKLLGYHSEAQNSEKLQDKLSEHGYL